MLERKELKQSVKVNLPEKQQQPEWQKEEEHLKKCIEVIQHNIDDYMQKYSELSEETKELYDNYRSNNPELHNDLVIGLDMKSMMQQILERNLRALKKPYFGRIDYREEGDMESYRLYLGKNGIRKNISESLIVDWRSPISSVYYDSDIGKSSYQTPLGDYIGIMLDRKRTYEISDSKLIDFYDSDVVANDEFLTKYLSKNKEVVLGEIIATIQKEQNQIIRDTPWHNVIVQGVAGSGKTTVAMHRISYILYNYKDKFRPDEFYIIGSNKMLLNYITGVLPNFISHIIIDEAQDFGVMLFLLFKKLLKTCTYTIMGDVSQNIYYDTGMNDWETLKQEVFFPAKDRFYILAKSYRNTVEISEYASRVLKKCSFQTYDIEPIIRHGNEVSIHKLQNEQQIVLKTASIINDIQRSGYDTIAIICRTVEETQKVRKSLKQYVDIEQMNDDMENITFHNGIMVLPIYLTKGLEFDAVILWNPTEVNYRVCDSEAKLMYVAITRALHELYVVYQGELSGLLK